MRVSLCMIKTVNCSTHQAHEQKEKHLNCIECLIDIEKQFTFHLKFNTNNNNLQIFYFFFLFFFTYSENYTS